MLSTMFCDASDKGDNLLLKYGSTPTPSSWPPRDCIALLFPVLAQPRVLLDWACLLREHICTAGFVHCPDSLASICSQNVCMKTSDLIHWPPGKCSDVVTLVLCNVLHPQTDLWLLLDHPQYKKVLFVCILGLANFLAVTHVSCFQWISSRTKHRSVVHVCRSQLYICTVSPLTSIHACVVGNCAVFSLSKLFILCLVHCELDYLSTFSLFDCFIVNWTIHQFFVVVNLNIHQNF